MVPEILIDRLFAKHRDRRGEKRSCKTGMGRCLDGDGFWRASSGDGVGVCVREVRTVHGLNQDLHAGSGQLGRIQLGHER